MFSLALTLPLIIGFALLGLFLGFLRAIIVFAFVVAGWFFLVVLHGGQGLANFLFERAPVIIAYIFGQAAPKTSPPSSLWMQITTIVAFAIIGFIGYMISIRVLDRPNLGERFWGVIPGAAMGYGAASALNSIGFSLFIFMFQPGDPMSYIPLIVMIIGVAFFVGLLLWFWVRRHHA